jgi:hypothetical protein
MGPWPECMQSEATAHGGEELALSDCCYICALDWPCGGGGRWAGSHGRRWRNKGARGCSWVWVGGWMTGWSGGFTAMVHAADELMTG